jgi:hypothetical protein
VKSGVARFVDMKTTYIGASGKSYEFMSFPIVDRNKYTEVGVVAVLVIDPALN